ncbi:MAG: right-handed parallel beta-helix repeat-containing protein [Bacteroidales bacterium]
MRSVLYLAVVTICMAGCSNREPTDPIPVFPAQEEDFGWITEEFDEDQYATILYVSAGRWAESGDGSIEAPYRSVKEAVEKVSAGSFPGPSAILVAEGNYSVQAIHLIPGIHLFGGFDTITWERDVDANRTILKGSGDERILVGENGCRIDGFQITGGRYRGNGGAIYCRSIEMEISNNMFIDNTTLEPVPWSPAYIHEKAHDGGAIYAGDGASLMVRRNIFRRNTTENGRGAAVAFHNGCRGEIRNNLFMNNTAGLRDEFRSSDGGAVSVFDWCDVDVIHNLFMGNRALSKNDGGALFYALWSSGTIHGNYFFNNRSMDDAGALFIGGQEHRYDAPLDPLPPEEEFFVTVDANVFMGNGNPSQNSGAFRITMESRGSITNNLIAFNNGAYFQRSDLDISNNTIADNLLLIETKEGLNPCRLNRNIFLGKVQIETAVEISDCLFPEDPEGGVHGVGFRKDGFPLNIVGQMVGENNMETRLTMAGPLEENILKNRVVKSGDRFTLVKENRGNMLIVFGDLPVSGAPLVMPTYTPESFPGTEDIGAEDATFEGKTVIDLYGYERAGSGVRAIGAVAGNNRQTL